MEASVLTPMARKPSYAVAWRKRDEEIRVGKLEMAADGLRLEAGRRRGGRVSVLRVFYRDLLGAGMARVGQRIDKRPTVALGSGRGPLWIAPVGVGVAREVLALIHSALETVERPDAISPRWS
jgi:hypothetical protein